MKITSPRSAPVRPGHPAAAAPGTAEHPAATAGRLLVRYGLVVVMADRTKWPGARRLEPGPAAHAPVPDEAPADIAAGRP